MATDGIGNMRMYTFEEIVAIVEKACDLGYDEVVEGSMTIGELDHLVNGDAN